MKASLTSQSSMTDKPSSSMTLDNKSSSPNASPKSSPRPSPRPQTKRDHSRNDAFLSVNYKESSTSNLSRTDSSQSSQDSRLNLTDNPSELSKSESNSAVGNDKKDVRSKKKSAWYNALLPTYKSRSQDFKQIFKDVPDEERLVVDYSCALQKEILVHGRLFVSQKYLCFYANIFGWETNVTIKWKEVAAITKEKTALVFPNAILIGTRSEKYFFTSFVARDKTYLMLFRIWQNALMDQPMTQQEMWQLVHQCYGDELGLTSDDEDYVAPGTEEDKLSVSVGSVSEDGASVTNIESPISDIGSTEDNMELKEDKERHLVLNGFSKDDNLPDNNQLPTDMSDTTESDVEKTASPVCSELHEGKRLVDEVIHMNIDQLFTLLFTSSKFYLDFHAARKTSDITQTAWTHNPMDNTKSRTVNLTVAHNQTLGPKTLQVTETQTLLACSKAGSLYSVNQETINGGIPYADSFGINLHFCLQRVSPTHSSLHIYAQIKYKKTVWGLVKGMIEKNVWQGFDDFYGSLTKALHNEADESSILTRKASKTSQKRRAPRLPRSLPDSGRPSKASITRTKSVTPTTVFRNDIVTLIVFGVLILLVILNILLYIKLWSLEDTSPVTFLDLQMLKDPPKTHDEWLKLFQQQETLHTVEIQKWQKILKTAIHLLRQTEESLNELQRSIHPSYTKKIMSIIQNHKDALDKVNKEL